MDKYREEKAVKDAAKAAADAERRAAMLASGFSLPDPLALLSIGDGAPGGPGGSTAGASAVGGSGAGEAPREPSPPPMPRMSAYSDDEEEEPPDDTEFKIRYLVWMEDKIDMDAEGRPRVEIPFAKNVSDVAVGGGKKREERGPCFGPSKLQRSACLRFLTNIPK